MSAIPTSTTPVSTTVPRVDSRPAACWCGQDLDVATGDHCPRCGAQVGPAHFEPTGFWHAA